METLKAIFSRRSIRNFLHRPLEPEKVELLLKAAMQAPSAMNEQPWQFVVIDERLLFEKIMQSTPFAGMLKTAPLAILVCGDLRLERAPGNWVLDCAAATENLLLAASGLGLGATWVGIYPEADRMEALAALLELPPEVRPLALVAVGYGAALPQEHPQRFDAKRVHLNRWSRPFEVRRGGPPC